MDLWSKGLGRLVLQLRLSERSSMTDEETSLVMRGTMGKPTFWDWSVHLDADDVVDFLVFLKRPEVIRLMIESDERWAMLRSALLGAILFGSRALVAAVLGDRRTPSANGGAEPCPGQPAKEKS